ncbi:MAG: phosphoribosylanthranilate isomerase [Ignavibacteriales bacterium]|nr:phosphoribosylanthranilate isomerase [Ignavibacteriales bacterium]MCB9258261.1 phosphoribosylanthranilate isomerase [Ignavibacteriales bacterium]
MSEINFKNFIQVAGIIDQTEADLVKSCGVNFLGFPLRLPVNKEDLTEENAAKIINNLKAPFHGVIISYSSTADEVFELCNKLGSNIIQLHGRISIDELQKIKRNPKIVVIKSLVITEENFEQLKKDLVEMENFVDAFITDTFDPKTGASGATGKTHDWNISKTFAEISKKPLILAGGLNSENVYEAIIKVNPAGVDVHTGVENSNGRKDKKLLEKFVSEAEKAFNFINGEK